MLDDPRRFLTGAGRFTEDLARPDALHLAVVRSDLPHAVIGSIDVSEAWAVPGVVLVFTGSDLDPVPLIPIRVAPTPTMARRRQTVIAIDRVRYVGEPIAAVVAETAAAAADAARAVRVDLSPLPVVGGVFESASELWSDHPDNTLVEVAASFGNHEEVFAGADHVFEFELDTSRRTGLPMETRQLIAEWVDEELHLWGATKLLQFTRRTLAEMLGVEPSRVVLHRADVGGMFGVRGEVYPEDYLVAWAARTSGRMVRWHEGRREHFLAINQSGEQHHRLRVAVTASGRFLALQDRVFLDMGAYPRPIGSRIPHIIVETLPGPYRWDAVDLHCRGFATNKTPIGTIRGPAAFETTFVRERVIDAVASRLGIPPFELRQHNLIDSASIPYLLPFHQPAESITYDSGDFPGMLDHFASLIDYQEIRRTCAQRRGRGEVVGTGWGLSLVHSGLGREESVTLELIEDGTFHLGTSAADVGQGLEVTMKRFVSEGLRVPLDSVRITSGNATVAGNGTFSSRSTIFVGNAISNAATVMRDSATERAAKALGCQTSEIRLTEQGIEAVGEIIRWKELAPISVVGEFKMERPTYGLAIHLAQVGVDTETGEVHTERLWIGYDCGFAIDRRNTVDQLVGAAAAGIGGALHERLVFEDAIPLAGNLGDYLVLRAPDMPEFRVHLFEFPSPGNPMGVKGAGEAGLIGVGAAVANAVADAIGDEETTYSLPIQLETVFDAIQSGSSRESRS
jgi:CO/xanthine dehydrogenase Mo-binding subunit